MLVLERKIGEKIEIGGGITIMLVAVKSASSVRIGIEAPPGVNIVRAEIFKKFKVQSSNCKIQNCRPGNTKTSCANLYVGSNAKNNHISR